MVPLGLAWAGPMGITKILSGCQANTRPMFNENAKAMARLYVGYAPVTEALNAKSHGVSVMPSADMMSSISNLRQII